MQWVSSIKNRRCLYSFRMHSVKWKQVWSSPFTAPWSLLFSINLLVKEVKGEKFFKDGCASAQWRILESFSLQSREGILFKWLRTISSNIKIISTYYLTSVVSKKKGWFESLTLIELKKNHFFFIPFQTTIHLYSWYIKLCSFISHWQSCYCQNVLIGCCESSIWYILTLFQSLIVVGRSIFSIDKTIPTYQCWLLRLACWDQYLKSSVNWWFPKFVC